VISVLIDTMTGSVHEHEIAAANVLPREGGRAG
jgi:hypothetical protein